MTRINKQERAIHTVGINLCRLADSSCAKQMMRVFVICSFGLRAKTALIFSHMWINIRMINWISADIKPGRLRLLPAALPPPRQELILALFGAKKGGSVEANHRIIRKQLYANKNMQMNPYPVRRSHERHFFAVLNQRSKSVQKREKEELSAGSPDTDTAPSEAQR